MKRRFAGPLMALGLVFFLAAPGSAQMWGFPDYMVPQMRGAPQSWVAGSYARGLNDASGELNAFGAAYGRTGESASFQLGFGVLSGEGDSEATLGGAVGIPLSQGESFDVAVQGGLGWFSSGDFTFIRVPIGVSFSGGSTTESGAAVVPWAMPRLNIARISFSGESDTETDLGISGGVNMTFPSGFGFHAALDILLAGEDPLHLGFGVQYLLGSGGN